MLYSSDTSLELDARTISEERARGIARACPVPTASERIRAARENSCEQCDKPATHLSGIGNGYKMRLCADHTNHRLGMYAAAPQPCKQPWYRSL